MHPERRLPLSLLFVCASLLPAGAQVLTGTVVDTTGAAVAGVAVVAAPAAGGPARTTATGPDGTYRLALAHDGVYDVSFSRVGFVNALVRQAVTGDTTLDRPLDLTSFTDEVRVAASLGATRGAASHLGLTAAETPAALDVVTQDVIQARGADTASTALRFVTGVTSSLRPGASAVFSSRGFVENSLAVLFNGVRVQSSTITMRNYDAFNFERVEVVRGPASVIHGEGASVGAINFVRREPVGGRQAAEGLLEVGDAGRLRVGAAATGGVGSAGAYSVSFARNAFDTHVDGAAHEYLHGTGALRWNLSRVTIGAEADVMSNDVDDPYWGTPLVANRVDASLFGVNYNRAPDNRYADVVGWGRITATARLRPGATYNGQVYVYRADRDWRNNYGFEFVPASGRVTRRAVENLAYDHRLWGTRHDVTFDGQVAGRPVRAVLGVDGAFTDFSSPRSYGPRVTVDLRAPEALPFTAPDRLDDRRADVTQLAVFSELRVSLSSRVSVVAGARAATLSNAIARPASGVRFDQDFTPVDGRLGLVVTPAAGVTAYATYASGSEPVEALLILGPAESSFDLARSGLWEAGVKADLFAGKASVVASAYHLAKRDLTTADPNDASRTVQVGEQSSRGIELSVVARPASWWQIEANLAALNARYDVFFEGAVSRNGNLPPNVPELVANVGTTVRPTSRLEAGVWVSHVGRRTADTTSTVFQDAYTLVEPFARLSLGRAFDVTARIRNATDARFAEWATRAFGVTNVYFGEPRRAIISLRARF